VVALAAREGSLFALHFNERMRRATLTRILRDGSSRTKVAHHDGPSEPKSFSLTQDAAYFTRQTNVFRANLSTGETQEVLHSFSEAIAIAGEFVYGIACGKGAASDTLVRASWRGGEREPLADLPHVPVNRRASGSGACDYHYLAVAGDVVFISDWAGRRILSVLLPEKTMHVVAQSGSYPMRITLEPNSIVYQAEGGLYRVERGGGNAVRLAELAQTPFTTYTFYGHEFWINQSEAYTDTVWIYRLADANGTPRKVIPFKAYEGCPYPCDITDGIAVDDECLYVAHREEHTDSLFAWQKDR